MRNKVSWILVILALPLTNCNKSASTDHDTSTKFSQYYRQGELLYLQHCSNCHQANGTGLGRVYPPLNQSDYMTNNVDHVICLIKYGIDGEMIVNGVDFNQPMPGIPSLTSLEVAQLATYIYNTWSHERGLIDVKETEKILDQCK